MRDRGKHRVQPIARRRDKTCFKPKNSKTPARPKKATYDKNGNILTMKRNGEYDDVTLALQIDDLAYSYRDKTNILLKVADATNNPNGFKDVNIEGDDYKYDDNGNLNYDLNKNILGITYNHLNLPVQITFANGNTIAYLYDAVGRKLKKTITQGATTVTTEYLDGFQYKNNVLEFFATAEGYVKNTVDAGGANRYNYVFNYTDHLGNVRLSYTQNPSTQALVILEENNYYPYGLKHRNYNVTERVYRTNGMGNPVIEPLCAGCSLPYNYKYNGKEWQDELGLNMTAMDFRLYDNAIGRFNAIDALAEVTYSQSPYQFANDNPIGGSDPTGLLTDAFIDNLWNYSAGISTTWENDGSGNFINEDGSGVIYSGGDFFSTDITAGAGNPPYFLIKFIVSLEKKYNQAKVNKANELVEEYNLNENKIAAYSVLMELLTEITEFGELATEVRERIVEIYGTDDLKQISGIYSNAISVIKEIKSKTGGNMADPYIYDVIFALGARSTALYIKNAGIEQSVKFLDTNTYNQRFDYFNHDGGSFSGGGAGGSAGLNIGPEW